VDCIEEQLVIEEERGEIAKLGIDFGNIVDCIEKQLVIGLGVL